MRSIVKVAFIFEKKITSRNVAEHTNSIISLQLHIIDDTGTIWAKPEF